MISYDEAVEIIQAQGEKKLLGSEVIALSEIPGRVCAEEIKSSLTVQPFDNSAMDGFALKAADIAAAGNDNAVELLAVGKIAAGDTPSTKMLSSGECVEIMTGAPVPGGADTVVPVENIERSAQGVVFKAAAKSGNNVRLAGEDFKPGMMVLEEGAVLAPHHVLVLATLGVDKVNVRARPKIGFIPTGKELVDDLKQDLQPGQIYNSNGPYLQAALSALGSEVHSYKTIADEEDLFAKVLDQAMDDGMDVVLTTGAVSAGAHDFVRGVLEGMGAEILFHKVKIRPGKPILFARLSNGTLFVGLPGNPSASVAGLRFFVCPLLRAMAGQPPEQPEKAMLLNDHAKKKEDFRFFLKAALTHSDKATKEARLLTGQQSFMVRSFLGANVWAVAPEGVTALKAGDFVDIYSLLP